jgi:hypothetical protein
MAGLLFFEHLVVRRPEAQNMTVLGLGTELSSPKEGINGKKILREGAYFLEFLECASRPQPGEFELIECFICPLRGNKLYTPPGDVLATIARLVSETRIRVHYFLIFEKRDLGLMEPQYVEDFLRKLEFAQISFIFVDAETRERFSIPQRSFKNRVAFAARRIVFVHDRDHTGRFTGARRYEAASSRKIFSELDELRLLAESREAIEVGNGLRAFLPRQRKQISEIGSSVTCLSKGSKKEIKN